MQKTWTFLNNLVMILSLISYGIFLIVIGSSSQFNSFGVMGVAFSSPRTYLLLILVSGLNFLVDLSTYSYFMLFMKNLTETLRVLIKEVGIINHESQLTPEMQIYYEKYKFALSDGMSNTVSPNKNVKANIKNIEKIDRIEIELNSDSSFKDNNEDNPEIMINDMDKKMYDNIYY